MTARSQARDDAVVVLLAAGWDAERIRQALGITEALAARLVRQARPARPPPAITQCVYKLGSHRGQGLYCDDPVTTPGAVYCARHVHVQGVWVSAS